MNVSRLKPCPTWVVGLCAGLVISQCDMSTARAADKMWDFTNDPSGELTIAGNNDQPWQNAGGNPGGFLALTYPQNSQYAAIVFPNLDPGRIVTGFTLSADLRIGNPSGDRAADGFSVSLARDGDPILADPGSDSGFAGRCCAETGTRTGIAVSFDTWSGNTFPNDPADTTDIEGVIVRLDDVTVKKVGLPTRNGACDDLTSLQTGPRDASFWAAGGDTRSAAAWKTLCWKTLAVNLTTDGRLTVSWKGNILLDGFQTTYFPTAGQLVLAARTGGANEHTHCDNLKLTTIAQTVTVVPGAPSNLKAAEAGANRVLLTWDKAVVAGDPNAKVAYDVLRDGNVIASTLTSLSFEDRGVNPGRSYTYIVRGKNIAGTAGPNATLSVKTAGLVDTLGFLQAKVWYGIGGTAVDALLSDPHYQDPPDSTRYVNGFSFGETSNFGNTYGDNFGVVIQGSFTAPETGSYRFFVRSDDASQLFITTAGGTAPDPPTVSTPIANEDGCCKGFLEDAPYASEPIALTAGRQYGLTFVVKEGGGGDWGQVAIRKEGDSTPAGNLTPIRGAILAGKGDSVGASVSFVRQPANLTVTANDPVEMSAEATGSSPYGADYGKAVVYQWYVNNAPVLGANGPVFSVNVTPKAYNGAKVKVVASVAGASATSAEAILTVNDDKVAPTVKRVGGSESFDSMTVIFSEPVVDPSALNAANYKVTGLNVSSPVRVNDRTIRLTTSRQQVDTRYDLSINGVLDLAGNPSAYIGSFVSYRFQSGVVRFDTWNNEGGGFDTFPRDRAPDNTFLKDQYFTGTGLFENYFGQLKGLFKAPKTGDYVFWISTDDHGELYLSSDENPANKRKIAEEPVWCDPMYWKTDGGANSGSRGGDGQLANRSDQYPGTEWPGGAGAKITLTAGKTYYLEVLYKEGGGGDHGAATFTYLGDAVPENGSTALKGDLVGWYIDPQTAPPILTQAPTTQFYARGGSFRFDVGVQSALPVTVRWYQNKKLIEGVSGTTLEVQNADARHVGDYYAVISNENGSVSTWPDNNARAIMTGAYVIEAEDYNHGRGNSIPMASTMPVADSLYRGLDGIPGTDFQFNNSTEDPCANGNSYRNGWNNNGNCVAFTPVPGGNVDVVLDNGVNQERPDYTAANNYKIGWTGATTWFNYTRTLQPGVYNAVFVGSRDGLDPNFNTVALEVVTDPMLENAPGIEVARVTFANTGGWSSNDQIPFVSPDGSPSPIPIDGTTTLRLRCTQGNPEFDYVLLYRASGVAVAQNPADQQSVAGTTLILTAKVAGLGLTYRWQKDGVDLVDDGRVSGAATDTLRIGGVAPSDAGRYRLWSSNAEGTVETTEAVVTVLVPPAIVEQPQSVEGLLEETVTLRVGVVGSPTPTLQWFKNDSLIPGATSDTGYPNFPV